MLNRILLNQFINAIGFFAEKRLVCLAKPGKGEAGVESTAGKDSPAEKAAEGFFRLLDKTVKQDEAKMSEQEKEVWLKEQKEKSTADFRANLEKGRSSLPTKLPGSDYEVADLFIKNLRGSYGTVEAQSKLFYVDPTFDKGSSVTTGPKEDPCEIRVDVNRGGGDTRIYPTYMWVKFQNVDGVPGVTIRWTADKDASGNDAYNNVPLTTKEDAAKISTLPKAKDLKIEGVEYLDTLGAGLSADNPYADKLKDALVNSKVDFSKVDVKRIVRKSDRLVLKCTDDAGAEKELEFGGYEYRAIFWKEISGNVAKVFAGKSVSVNLMALAARDPAKNPKFDKLVEAIAIDPSKVKDGDALAKEAFAELEKLRPMLNIEGSKGIVGIRSEMERTQVLPDLTKREVGTLESGLGNKDFAKQADKEMEKFGNSIDGVKREVTREYHKVDANQWRVADLEGINRAYNEWSKLGIAVDTAFYVKVFCMLRDGLDPAKNPSLKNPQYAEWFKSPERHINDIRAIKDDSGFAEAYATAVGFFMGVKQNILGRDDSQLAALDKQRKLDGEPVTQKAIDVVRDNFNKFTKSIKEGDYATAGLYAVGIWAVYKSLGSLFGGGGAHGEHGAAGDKGIDWKKWAIYGLAGYTGYIFAKNAGYDVLKMAGMKRGDAEVAGTPLEAIPKIVAQLHLKEAEDLDYDVAARMSEVKVTDLYNEYQKANNNGGIRFIHPNQFPQIFPGLANVGFFDLGIGGEGLQDHEGNANKRLSTKQREYINVGRQLYKLMLVIETAYPETLGRDTHMSFADAMKDPILKEAKIRHIFAGMGGFVNPASSEWGSTLDYLKIGELAKRDLRKAFDGFKEYPIGFTVEAPDKALSGGMKGTIMGYPVIFLYDASHKKYQVYFANEFKTDEQAGKRTPISEISTEGGNLGLEGVKKAADKVKARMEKLLRQFDSKYGKPEFNGSVWTAKMKLSSVPEFGINNETPITVVFSTSDGNNLVIESKEVGFKFTLDETAMKTNTEKFILMNKFLQDPNMRAFNVLSRGNKLDITDVKKSSATFKLGIANVGVLDVKFEGGGFKIDPADEKKMVQNETFGRVYTECLANDNTLELNKVSADLGKAIDDAPQSFVKNLWESLVDEGWNLGALTGSIANNLSKSVVEVTKYETFQNIRRSMLDPKVTTLKDVEKARDSALSLATGNLKNVIAKLSRHDDNWKKDEFKYSILAPIREANAKSDVYARTRQGLEVDLYKNHTKADFTSGGHKSVENQMKVFVHYTSYLDTKSLDSVKSGVKLPADAKTNPAYRAYFVYNYLNYVRNAVSEKKFSDPEQVPAPTDPSWGIKDFNDYLNDPAANVDALEVTDNRPPLKNTLSLRAKPGEGYTELDVAVADNVRKLFRRLEREYGDNLKPGALENYLSKDPTPEALANPSFDAGRDAGLFSIYKDPATRRPACKLWQITDQIAGEVSGKKLRGDQEQVIDRAVEEYVMRDILKNPDRGIFKDPQTAREWIAKNWQWGDRQIRRVGAWWNDDEPPEETAPSGSGKKGYEGRTR